MPAEPQRTAVVTGANRGIGRETAKQLVERGLRVVVTGRDENAVRGAAAEIAKETDRADGISHHALDVADPASVQAFRDWIERERGRVDVLVNNAGVYLDEGVSFFDVDEETVRRTLEINLHGPLRLCQAFVSGMRERGWGAGGERLLRLWLDHPDGWRRSRSIQDLQGGARRADPHRRGSGGVEREGERSGSGMGQDADGRAWCIPPRPGRGGGPRLGRHPPQRRPDRQLSLQAAAAGVVKYMLRLPKRPSERDNSLDLLDDPTFLLPR